MLIHLAPKCHSPWVSDIALISVEIPELSMKLRGGKELRARRPYPNKDYVVASANADRAAKDGFFVESTDPLSEFHVVSKWEVDASVTVVCNHRFTVLDDEFDAVSPDPTMWLGHYQSWERRWPDEVPEVAPIKITPVLKLDQDGRLVSGQEHFLLPTLERKRVLECAGSILPGNRQPSAQFIFKEGEA